MEADIDKPREPIGGRVRHTGAEARRARIVEAMEQLVCERGFVGVSVSALCTRARVSRRSFYALFAGRKDCFLAVLDEGHRQASMLLSDAFAKVGEGDEPSIAAMAGLRGALAALLYLLEERPRLARIWLVESVTAGAWALERRERNVAVLTEQILEYWGPPEDGAARPLTAESVMAAVLGLLQRHAIGGTDESFLELLGPLMGAVSAPYLDSNAVGAQIEQARDLARRLLSERATRAAGQGDVLRSTSGELALSFAEDPAGQAPATLLDPRAHRARSCVAFLAEHPGASNREVAEAIGVSSHAQISALLARLERAGLLCAERGAPGQVNAWRLNTRGQYAATVLSKAHRAPY